MINCLFPRWVVLFKKEANDLSIDGRMQSAH